MRGAILFTVVEQEEKEEQEKEQEEEQEEQEKHTGIAFIEQ